MTDTGQAGRSSEWSRRPIFRLYQGELFSWQTDSEFRYARGRQRSRGGSDERNYEG